MVPLGHRLMVRKTVPRTLWGTILVPFCKRTVILAIFSIQEQCPKDTDVVPFYKTAPFFTFFRNKNSALFCGKWCPWGNVLESSAPLVGGPFAITELVLVKRAPVFKTVPKGHCFGSIFFLSVPLQFNTGQAILYISADRSFYSPPHTSIPHFKCISIVFMLLPNIICRVPK